MDGIRLERRRVDGDPCRQAMQDDRYVGLVKIRSLLAGLLSTIAFVALTESIRPAMAQPASNAKNLKSQKQDLDSSEETQDSETKPITLRGRCIDHLDKTPMTGVVVRVFEIKGYTRPVIEILNTITDEKGEYEFANMIPPRSNSPTDRLFYLLLAEAENRPIGYGGSWTLNESDPSSRDSYSSASRAK